VLISIREGRCLMDHINGLILVLILPVIANHLTINNINNVGDIFG